MSKINIDLDDNLVEYIKEKCDRNIESDVETIIKTALEEKNIDVENVSISISAVDKETIHKINKEYRNVDRPTDVLSFPIFEREEINSMATLDNNKKVKEMELGDIIICIDVLQEHAVEYQTGILREMLYMITHGVCHLLGYDHEIEEEKREMRALEEKILNKIGVGEVNGK
ncbi:MAG: rRNA maturation RNase YbeY [Clostridia bacterium]|nr:rRNA maturation RNase YbeY [Clostridia bacterium]